MSLSEDLSLQTRRSLLSRLRDHEDKESWQTFFDRYWRLLYNVARRAGLDDVDAQDVVQDTVIAVAKEIPDFRYDRERGTFKQWLFRILRRRVSDHFRKLYRRPAHADISPETLEETGDADAIVMRDGAMLERSDAILDGAASVAAAGLVYVTDSVPGIRRVRNDDGFIYRMPNGRRVTDEEELARIAAIHAGAAVGRG